jgi:lantibiotic biosynthesis protein
MIVPDDDVAFIERLACKAESLLPEHPSLFAGLSGLSLLYCEIYRLRQNDKYAQSSIRFIEKSIHLLDDKYSELTLANGVAGVGWVVKYLLKTGILTKADENVLDNFDELLLESLNEDDFYENKTYDLLYGLIGKGIYFLEDDREANRMGLKLVLEKLMLISSRTDHGITWYDSLGKDKMNGLNEYLNYGLAHGLPSIIIFLGRLYEKRINQDICIAMIKSVTSFIKTSRLKGQLSNYPSNSLSATASKLSWCYGDIGIALAFLKASEILSDENLKSEAIDLLINSSERKLVSSYVRSNKSYVENGFCHGTLGLSYLYYQAYDKTKLKVLLETSEYWLYEVNKVEPHQLSTIISRNYDFESDVWNENGSLLNGYCGIGLVLLRSKCNHCRALESITLT